MRSPTLRRRSLALLAALVGLSGALVAPAAAAAHPLGNFTINHYAGIRVSADEIRLDVVVDLAEIPAFQERISIDTDGDGDVSGAEADAAREGECRALIPQLRLTVDGAAAVLDLEAAGLTFPPGAGGVPTMRVVCELVATLPAPLADGTAVAYEDTSYNERIGWREIVVLGDGLTIAGLPGEAAPSSTEVSDRLTAYPKDLLTQPLDVTKAQFTVAAGGPAAAPFTAPDAQPLAGAATPVPSDAPSGSAGASAAQSDGPSPAPAAVPGGVGSDIPGIFRAVDLTPLVALASILLAMALGAGHALTPGHGKTLMAAYLVGTRGTVRHAAGLGLAVTVSHTIGILVLALLVTGAEATLPPDLVVRWIPVVAALAFVAIGLSMVVAEFRRRRQGARLVEAAHEHEHEQEQVEAEAHDHADGHAHAHSHEHDHARAHGHEHPPRSEHRHSPEAPGTHSHGGVRHSHLPAEDRTLSWRNLFALGLAGGIIPSTNALIILLGTIVAGRAAFGVVLVVAFGLGMAIVLGGVGAVMVLARDRLERLPLTTRLGRVAAQAPLIASIAVLGIGLWLTAQAVGGPTPL